MSRVSGFRVLGFRVLGFRVGALDVLTKHKMAH